MNGIFTTFYVDVHLDQIEVVLEFKVYLWPSQTCSDFVVSCTLGMLVTILVLSSTIHCHDVQVPD